MFGQHHPLHRDEAEAGDSASPMLGRSEALALFFRLQSRGYFPCMVEEENGQYRVFTGDRQ